MATAELTVNEKSSYDGTHSEGNSKDADADEDAGMMLTDVERNRVLRKVDLHILPFVSLLYLLSFLCVTFLRLIVQPC